MRLFHKLRRRLGSIPLKSRYAYGKDSRYGHVSESRVADKWVKTTCGYCSVGCGMLVGVKDGKAVAVRGNPDHPVNRGKLCPKGLSEHHILDAPGRATQPLLRKNGKLEPVSWDEALETMIEQHRHHPGKSMDAIRLASSAPDSWLPKSSIPWASWCSSASARPTTTATPRSAWPARSQATSSPSAATALRATIRIWRLPTSSC